MLRGLFRLVGFCLILGFSCFTLMGVWIVYDGIHDDKAHADVAVVYGYGETKDGVPEPDLQARLDRTAELYGEGKFTNIIVSGVTLPGEKDETAAMAQYLEAHQVPASAIIKEYRGQKALDSVDTLVQVMKDQRFQSVMVINTYYRLEHMKLALRHAGIKYVEQAHSGMWRKEDLPGVIDEDINIYTDLNNWYLLSTEKEVQEKVKEESKVAQDEFEKLKKQAQTDKSKWDGDTPSTDKK